MHCSCRPLTPWRRPLRRGAAPAGLRSDIIVDGGVRIADKGIQFRDLRGGQTMGFPIGLYPYVEVAQPKNPFGFIGWDVSSHSLFLLSISFI